MTSNDKINDILQDDVVQYISARHHVASQVLLDNILLESGKEAVWQEGVAVELDDNEYLIIHDLIRMYNINKE